MNYLFILVNMSVTKANISFFLCYSIIDLSCLSIASLKAKEKEKKYSCCRR